jgi:hypothetical protein
VVQNTLEPWNAHNHPGRDSECFRTEVCTSHSRTLKLLQPTEGNNQGTSAPKGEQCTFCGWNNIGRDVCSAVVTHREPERI